MTEAAPSTYKSRRQRLVLVAAAILAAIGVIAIIAFLSDSDRSANSLVLGLTMIATGAVIAVPYFRADINPVNFMTSAYGVVLMAAGVGAFISQRIDDADLATAIVTSTALVVVGALLFYFGRFGAASGSATLLRIGIPGRAQVLAVDETNIVVNNRSIILPVRLLVQLPGSAEYDVTTRVAASFVHGTSLHAGQEVAVRVHPTRPKRLIIDWDRSPE